MTSGRPDLSLTGFARAVERNGRRIAELDALVRRLAHDVAGLARALPAATAAGERSAVVDGPRSWLLAKDPDEARAVLADLVEWVGAVYLRYAGAALPSCWLWHADVVEELLCLRQAHAAAYTARSACVQRAADWHDRLRPRVAERITRAHGRCELAEHVRGCPQARPAVPASVSAALDAVAEAWTSARAQPEPTDAQLAQADAQHRAAHPTRNRRSLR